MGQTTSDLSNIPGTYNTIENRYKGVEYNEPRYLEEYNTDGNIPYNVVPSYGKHTAGMKETWGPDRWHQLHIAAIAYPDSPTYADMKTAFDFVWSIVTTLPCELCRTHAVEYVLTNPIDVFSSVAFQKWVWIFHNVVNERLGKRVINYEEYRRIYANYFIGN